MATDPNLYSPRERQWNIDLIRTVVFAPDRASSEAGRTEFVHNLHPSLFAELDWMERTIPEPQRERAAEIVDDLFLDTLAKNIASRHSRFDLDEALLAMELDENRDFFDYVLEHREDVRKAFGPELVTRIERTKAEERPSRPVPRSDTEELGRIETELQEVRDRHILLDLMDLALSNALFFHLDHPPSRMRAKAFIRRIGYADGAGWPTPPIGVIASSADLEEISRFLAGLSSDAEEYRLGRLSATVRLFTRYLNETDVFSLNDFQGQRVVGYGPCERCSMMFASSALVSLDNSYLLLSESGNDRIHLPRFNFAMCPFCGHRARVKTPVMFYSDMRHQVIYCLPTHVGLSQEEAQDAYRPLIQGIRENYRRRIPADAATRFDKAPELVTYNIPDFLYAIQMGDLAQEAHVALLSRWIDGSGSIVDPTKKVIIDLAPEELENFWAQSEVPTASHEDISAAMSSFKEGRLEEARDMLEILAQQTPGDPYVLNNLGVVYAALGDKTRAREVLRLLRVGGPLW